MNISKNIFALIITIFAFSVCALGQTEKTGGAAKSNQSYDAELARQFGADDYGMKQYVFVVLKTGKAKIEDAEKRKELQAGHMKNISRLAEEGKLVLAGPFNQGGDPRGIYIFNVKTLEEAAELVKTDPAIKAGLFDVEMTRWYGSAALMNVNETHKKIQKKNF
jgi:uncharacterized protein YciI